MARPISKTTQFILTLPKTLPAKEVLAKAKARGIETSENNVHRVRRLHAAAAPAKTPASGSASGGSKAPASATPTKSDFGRQFRLDKPAKELVAVRRTGSSADDLLRAVAAEIGLGRAVDILQSERARVRVALQG
jgi:hypothetical protein